MNFIAGYLIIITKDEEKSFWLMDALLGKMLPGIVVVVFLMLFKWVFSYSDLIRGFYQVETGHGNARKVREMSAKLILYTPTKSREEVRCKTPVSVNQGGAELKTLMWSECVPMKIEEKLEYSIKSKT